MHLSLLLGLCCALSCARAAEVDLLVYGATPGGIAASLAAANDGDHVLLVEKSDRLGGMLTNGLSHPDFRSWQSLSGTFLDFTKCVLEAYRPELGAHAAALTVRGTVAEPKVNLAALEALLAAQPRITVQREWALEAVATSTEAESEVEGAMRALEVCLFADPQGERHSVPACFFIDATYEGDLMAAAGVPYRVGREGSKEFGEALAPAEEDAQLQGYSFRFCMTRDPENRVRVRAPRGYAREDYLAVLDGIKSGTIKSAFGPESASPPHSVFGVRQPPLPHGKFEVGEMPGGLVPLALTGANEGWPDGGGGVAIRAGVAPEFSAPPFSRVGLAANRQRILDEHTRWSASLLYFLQNDSALPDAFRMEAAAWGWCRDEFPENAHLPDQLLVPEARRMQGTAIFTESDCACEPGDARAVLHRDAIAIGDLGLRCEATAHEGARIGGRPVGGFARSVAPYQVPYGVLLPRHFENLLVVGAASSSHVGFCALHYEPVWMALGQAAGLAAHLARSERLLVAQVPVAKLQTRLHQAGVATVYVSDVPADSADFAAVQWWGTAGGFHGIEQPPGAQTELSAEPPAGREAAYPSHAAQLEKPLEEPIAGKWRRLSADLGLAAPPATPGLTRGAFLRAVWETAGQP